VQLVRVQDPHNALSGSPKVHGKPLPGIQRKSGLLLRTKNPLKTKIAAFFQRQFFDMPKKKRVFLQIVKNGTGFCSPNSAPFVSVLCKTGLAVPLGLNKRAVSGASRSRQMFSG
jgi:hypothetical protein